MSVPPILLLMLILFFAPQLRAEEFTVATYNLENFRTHFIEHKIYAEKPDWANGDEAKDLLDVERDQNDLANWVTSQVILDPKFLPDVMVFQEGCGQSDLRFFNKKWLNEGFANVISFPGNTTREQYVGVMVKLGFKILDTKADYYKEPDSVKNPRGENLFARGPAFVLVQTPAGYKFWIGTNHQKSKSGNNLEVTKWRLREAARTHAIIKEIESTGPSDVIFLGDMNDELGLQDFEKRIGQDAIATIVGPPEDGFVLETKALSDVGEISYGGHWKTTYRSFIDHVFATKSMATHVQDVHVFHNNFTDVSSDHYPVIVKIKDDGPTPTTQPTP